MMWRRFYYLALLIAAMSCCSGHAQSCDGTCFSSGDPHYQTFDCQKFEYHGKCSYVLMATCNDPLSNMPNVQIIGENERMQYHPQYAYTKSVTIITTDEKIKLTAEKEIFYNDVKQTEDTIEINNGKGKITRKDKEIVVKSDFGFTVRWGSPFKAEITIDDNKLRGQICGICGNANGDPSDDLVTPKNTKVDDFVLFADSWNAEMDCGPCTDCRADMCASHPESVVNEAHSKCEILLDKKGKLADCFDSLPPTYHHHLCVSEMCESLPDDYPLCDAISDFLAICQSYDIFEGKTVEDFSDCTPRVNECDDPASNDCDPKNGECVNLSEGYECKCNAGYEGDGKNCTDIDECLHNVCPRNSDCFNSVGSYQCTCYAGYKKVPTHKDCQKVKCPALQQIDNGGFNPPDSDFTFGSTLTYGCDFNYTLHGQINLTCQADGKWSDDEPTCVEVDPCEPNPCFNGGTCSSDDGKQTFTCACPEAFMGPTCKIQDIDDCKETPCKNGAECVDGLFSYTCNCLDGYIGSNCETEVDECWSGPCKNNGSCVDLVNDYECVCKGGYDGDYCENELSAVDVDIGGELKMNETFDEALKNSSSTAFAEWKEKVETEIQAVLANTMDNFTVSVSEFRNGSIIAFFLLRSIVVPASLGEKSLPSSISKLINQIKKLLEEKVKLLLVEAAANKEMGSLKTNADSVKVDKTNQDFNWTKCDDAPCKHGGVCTVDDDSKLGFTCACARGYTGETCGKATEVKSNFKLVGGFDKNEGRIMYFNGKKWVSYCDSQFSLNEGKVMCREIGLPEATEAGVGNFYGKVDYYTEKAENVYSCDGDEKHIEECTKSNLTETYCYYGPWVKCRTGIGAPLGEEGDVVLIGGSVPSEGRIYVYKDDDWEGLCSGTFGRPQYGHPDLNSVGVLCKMAGFYGVGDAYNRYFGYDQNLQIDNKVQYTCTGSEDSLFDCDESEDEYCYGQGSVVCETTDHCKDVTCENNAKCINLYGSFKCICPDFYGGLFCEQEWPCETDWLYYDGKCYKLSPASRMSFSDSQSECEATGANLAMPKQANHDLFLTDVISKQSHSSYWIGLQKGSGWPGTWVDGTTNSYTNWNYGDPFATGDCVLINGRHKWYNTKCDYAYYGHICQKNANGTRPNPVPAPSGLSEGDLLLKHGSNPSEGILYVVHDNELGTVCDDRFDNHLARMACKQLGFSGGKVISASKFGYHGEGRILLDELLCQGNEKRIADCQHSPWGVTASDHSEDVAISCSQEGPRLVEGMTSFEGRLEYRLNNEWGTVCRDDEWGDEDASVACEQLGFNGVTEADKTFAQGSGTIGLSDLTCTGDEATLVDCTDAKWGDNSCDHTDDVGVVCSQGNIRLVGVPSDDTGIVQIYHENEWGYICYMSLEAKDLVCKKLGFNKAKNVYIHTHTYGFQSDYVGKTWIHYVSCSGTETEISDCSIPQSWGDPENYCKGNHNIIRCE